MLILAILAVPAFFWFRFLYQQYVVIPSTITPMEAKMAASMKKAHEKPARPAPPAVQKTTGEKGDDKETQTHAR